VIRNLSRRSVLRGFGLASAGLALGCFGRHKDAPALPGNGLHPNVFVQVGTDGVVTLVCHRSEMGQGVRSSLPALLADELGADLSKVKVVQGDGDKIYGDQNTDGSSSVRKRYQDLRQAGATARAMLVTVAAKRWKVAESACVARMGQVTCAGKSFGFGELADEAGRLAIPDSKKVALRAESEFQYIGKELPLLDGPDLVVGKAQFGADIKLPGLLIAVIARPPVVGGSAISFNAQKAMAIPGVRKIVQLGAPAKPFKFKPLGGIAVVADNTWAALRGRAALEIVWDGGDNGSYDSAAYKDRLLQAVRKPGKSWRNVGDPDAALQSAAKVIEAIYGTPHYAHATMEPPCATARFTGDHCEIWAATQNPQSARDDVAEALKIPVEKVDVHVTLLGGGFGRKSKGDFVTEAALVSKAVGAPVRLQWTREDDLQNDYYLSNSVQKLAAGLDANGKVTSWLHRTAYPPITSLFAGDLAKAPDLGGLQQGVLDVPLDIPNVRAEGCEAKAYTRIGWLRSVANVYHAFAVQSFIDEIAHARKIDPRDNLLEIIGPARKLSLKDLGVEKLPNYGASLEEHPIDTARLRHVIDRVCALSRWDDRLKDGRALGLAAHRSFLAYVAVVVSVVKSPDGRIRVDEAWSVADAGQVVNLERVRAQFEGAVVFGLSLGMYGAITMKKGAVEQSNFHDHRLLRIAEAPRKIHVEIVESHGAPCGVGEPGVPPVTPALANALFALTGTRVRDLPIVNSLHV
jgi:isoquinoline 1-oxidoreductase beta subunit